MSPTVQAQESRTMADQYEVEFAAIPKPFQSVYGLETSTRLRCSGLPGGTKLTILGPNGADTDTENGLYVAIQNDHELWLQIFPGSLSGAASTSNPVKFLVVYPDGSTEVVDHTFTVYPVQKLIHSPQIDTPIVQEGVDTNLKIEDLPKGAQIQIVDSPAGWKTSVKGKNLTVNAPKAGKGSVITYVTFADGSTLPVTFRITVEPEPTTEPEPTDNSGSSSSTTIIALILGLLGLGGAVAFFFNYMAR